MNFPMTSMGDRAWHPAEAAPAEVTATVATDWLKRSTDGCSLSLDLSSLPARLDDITLGAVQEIAACPLPILPACDERYLMQCFRYLSASLPRQRADDIGGELILVTYQRMLGHQCREAIAFMTEEALRCCRWFPTIAECLEIIGRWRRNDEASKMKDRAAVIVRREVAARFDETMARLASRDMTQAEIDALPERSKRIAAERCYLWRHADGTFTIRPEPGAR